ncbi:pyrroloquinoline quinone-dependent dehydrogenase [Daejeonella lutea]|uniref:Quinoprotein glucose dehydrogenase n=1 Tax=Daejeonella lutea TaxID=572036 RepID=A0A1T5A3U1_9SPHI|nr:PQQ-binding-like beta-propeller repeat protein [Daejeonella lutea]SKB29662.1 quinoprotein glucose dehydrogenase [Daejeonella lutea]
MKRVLYIYIAFAMLISFSGMQPNADIHLSWSTFSGTNDGIRYASGDQITTSNASQLKVAWTYETGDKTNRTTIPTTPIMLNGVLYGVSPQLNLFALDALSGKQIWKFKPLDSTGRGSIRGISYWQNTSGSDKRIFYSTGPYLYAVNADDGKAVKSFGKGGFIDLRENLDVDFPNSSVAGNAAPTIYKNLLITSMRVSEGSDAVPGHIRAFDVITGQRKWIFHTIPQPGEPGYETWEDKDAWKRVGGANNWGGMALDEKRGIVYIPTGSATPDFYGANRKGSNLYANSLIALDANTGKYIWHFQVVHHDIWDRDLPANPNLVRVRKDGKYVDAVAQITKHGYIFMFDRVSGKPIFPINEVPVPASDLPGEQAWPTQPIPTLPEPFARQILNADEISDRSPEIKAQLLAAFSKYRSGKEFIPPSFQGGMVFPGFDGGGEWGGSAVDPVTQIMYISTSELPWWTQMIPNPALNKVGGKTFKEVGRSVYAKYCVSCHRSDLKGEGKAFPSLVGLDKKYNEPQLRQILHNGRNMMPSFRQIVEEEKAPLITYLLDLEDKEALPIRASAASSPERDITPLYSMNGYHRFYDKDGFPGIKPPWGTLNAVNLNTGKLIWKVPLGEFESLKKEGMMNTGTEIYGGPVVTRGGIVFVAGTQDEKIRAFDKTNGKVLWEGKLPAAGFATPAVYSIKGKQYVVIAAGGGKLGMRSGGSYVAFATLTH